MFAPGFRWLEGAPGLATICLLSGCGNLPNVGPSAGDISQASVGDLQSRYEFVDLTTDIADLTRQDAADGFASRFGDHRRSAEPVIGVGDAASVTIWEATPEACFPCPCSATRSAPDRTAR